jgi:hypothetical protein
MGGTNLYEFVGNWPVGGVDVLGLSEWIGPPGGPMYKPGSENLPDPCAALLSKHADKWAKNEELREELKNDAVKEILENTIPWVNGQISDGEFAKKQHEHKKIGRKKERNNGRSLLIY